MFSSVIPYVLKSKIFIQHAQQYSMHNSTASKSSGTFLGLLGVLSIKVHT